MLLLLYAIIHYLAAYVLHLVRTIFGAAIPTLFNILMKMFLLLLYLGWHDKVTTDYILTSWNAS